jgi:tRNA(Ser,Leu) C12 N-acetylase TAN1
MMEWNILATASMRQERYLLRLLSNYGDFKGSGYRGVVIGRVENVDTFLETLETLRQEKPEKLRPLSQIVPIERTFQFDLSDFKDKLREAISPYIELVENRRFYVRVMRRGHKGEISSLEVEQEMDAFVLNTLKRSGKEAQIAFKDPDRIIIVETVENRAGVGLITREMKEKYHLIKVK